MVSLGVHGLIAETADFRLMAREDGTVSHNGNMPEERRVAILEAARRAVGRRGYSATSMRDIAKEAGVAQALLHYLACATSSLTHFYWSRPPHHR